MNLDFFNSRDTNRSKDTLFHSSPNFIRSFLQELKQYVEKFHSTSTSQFTLDRFEDSFAVCENRFNKELVNISINQIPENAIEGDVLKFENNKYVVDIDATKAAKDEIKQLMDKL